MGIHLSQRGGKSWEIAQVAGSPSQADHFVTGVPEPARKVRAREAARPCD
jgi:hypothetical protein